MVWGFKYILEMFLHENFSSNNLYAFSLIFEAIYGLLK